MNYKLEIWQIIISFSASGNSLRSLQATCLSLTIYWFGCSSASASPIKMVSIPLCLSLVYFTLLFPLFDPAWYVAGSELPWVVSHQIPAISISPYRLPSGGTPISCALTRTWQLYQPAPIVLQNISMACTPFLKQSHLCSWLRTNNSMNTSAFILNNKVEMKRNFTLCVSWGLVFMFGLKKSILDWFFCIYCYCQRINWWIFHLMSQVEWAPRHTVRRILIYSASWC